MYQNQRSCLFFFYFWTSFLLARNMPSTHSATLSPPVRWEMEVCCARSGYRSLLPGAEMKRSGKLPSSWLFFPPPLAWSLELPTQVTSLGGNSPHFTQLPLETGKGFIRFSFVPHMLVELPDTFFLVIWVKVPFNAPSSVASDIVTTYLSPDLLEICVWA